MEDGYNKDMQKAKYAQSKLELTTLRGLTAATEIYYDPIPTETVIEEDGTHVLPCFAICTKE